MKKTIFAAMLMIVVSGQNSLAETYDLAKYLSAVRQYSKDLMLAGEERNIADAKLKQAVSAALPSVGFNAGYTRNFSEYYMYFDMAALNPQATGVAKAPFKRDNEYAAAVGLQQTIFSPAIGSAIRAARQYGKVTDYAYEASERAIIAGAKKLFYQCLLLDRVHGVAAASETNARENYENMQKKYDAGQISQFELLLAETRWRGAIPETQKALRNFRLALNTLKNMAGIDVGEEIALDGSLDDAPALPEEKAVDAILDARPDFQALKWQEELRKTGVRAAKSSFVPTVSARMAYSYTAQSDAFDLDDEENKYWFAAVELSVPLFTGGYRTAEVQKAKVELAKARIGIDKARESIANDVSNVYLRLAEAHERIESAKATVRAAEQAFQIAETTTMSGLSTQLQLKDARIGYDGAQLNYYAAIYDYLEAYFDWQLVTGIVN